MFQYWPKKEWFSWQKSTGDKGSLLLPTADQPIQTWPVIGQYPGSEIRRGEAGGRAKISENPKCSFIEILAMDLPSTPPPPIPLKLLLP